MLELLAPFILTFAFIVTGILVGMDEGMTMIMPGDIGMNSNAEFEGVRGHRWFFWYHAVGGVERLFLIMLGAMQAYWFIEGGSILLIIGCYLILWSSLEAAYAYARWYEIIPEQENVDFIIFDIILRGKKLIYWIRGRFILAVLLLVLGYFI